MMTKMSPATVTGRVAAAQGTQVAWWRAIRDKWASTAPPARVGVQHLILNACDVEIVRTALDRVGTTFGLRFDLDSCDGELVLLDADVVVHMSPQLVAAFNEGRPTVIVCGLRAGRGLAPADRVTQLRRQLRSQLARVPIVRERWSVRSAPDTAAGRDDPPGAQLEPVARRANRAGPEPHPGPRLVAPVPRRPPDALALGERQVLRRIVQGWRQPDAPPLVATYGTDAHLAFDFRSRQVLCDPKAMQFLCAQHEIPQPAADLWPGLGASAHPLDLAIWHLGIASAGQPLAAAPDDWWNVPLRASVGAVTTAERCTRVPSHLDLVRRLADGPVTPTTLRTQGQVSATDLRRVLQACLMLDLVSWLPRGTAAGMP